MYFSESGNDDTPPTPIIPRRRGSLANRSPRKLEQDPDLEKEESTSTCNDESPKIPDEQPPVTPKKRTGGWPKGVKRGPNRKGPGRPSKVDLYMEISALPSILPNEVLSQQWYSIAQILYSWTPCNQDLFKAFCVTKCPWKQYHYYTTVEWTLSKLPLMDVGLMANKSYFRCECTGCLILLTV